WRALAKFSHLLVREAVREASRGRTAMVARPFQAGRVVAWRLLRKILSMMGPHRTWHETSPATWPDDRGRGSGTRAALTALVVLGSAALVAPLGCAPETTAHPRVVYETATHRPLTPPLTHTTAPAANAPIADTGPIRRITAVSVRIPTSWQTPPLVGRLQHHRIVP